MANNFKLVTEEEPLVVENIVVTIYGEPSMGKTSLASTANNPLLIDYDKGIQRAVKRKKHLELNTWEGTVEFLDSGLIEDHGIKTLIVDTGGMMLDDYIGHFVMKENTANAQKGGGLSLKGYGAVKEVFNSFLRRLREKKIDLIVLCHSTDKSEGDVVKKIPKMTGGSYDILIGKSDLVGYMETVNDKRTLDFNSTDRHIGKNAPEFSRFEVPHYSLPEYQNFMEDVIAQTKQKMMAENEAQRQAVETVKEASELILKCVNLEALKEARQVLGIDDMAKSVQVQVMDAYKRKYISFWIADKLLTVQTLEQVNELIPTITAEDAEVHRDLKMLLHNKAIKDLGLISNKAKGGYEAPAVVATDTVPEATAKLEQQKAGAPASEKTKTEDLPK